MRPQPDSDWDNGPVIDRLEPLAAELPVRIIRRLVPHGFLMGTLWQVGG